MPSDYGKDLAASTPAHTRAGASALRPQAARPVVSSSTTVMSDASPDGALHQTNLTVLFEVGGDANRPYVLLLNSQRAAQYSRRAHIRARSQLQALGGSCRRK